MHVEPHLVSQPVRHEQRLRPHPDRVLHVAAHQAERFESLGDHHRRFVVHPVVERVRPGQFERAVVGRQHDVVNVFLPAGETSVDRECPREVAAIVHRRLCAGIDQHQPAALQDMVVIVVMQRFAVLRYD